MNPRSLLFLLCLAQFWGDCHCACFIARASEPTSETKSIRVLVVDSSGTPIEGADVSRSVWTEEKEFKANAEYATAADGVAEIALPRTMRILRLWVRKDGFAGLFANWSAPATDALPQELRVVMEKATTISGVVVDPDGQPIADARIDARLDEGGEQTNSETPFRYLDNLDQDGEAVRSDEQGRWSLTNVPPGDDLRLLLRVRHPDYLQDEYYGKLAAASGVTSQQLREGTARIVMPRGEVVRGQIADEAGQPIPQAKISWSRESKWMANNFVTADDQGKFQLPPMTAGKLFLAIAAKDKKPQFEHIDVTPEMPPVQITLGPGKELRLKIVDAQGQPIPEVRVLIEECGNVYSGIVGGELQLLDGMSPEKSDEHGVYAWKTAPDEALKLRLRKSGYGDYEGEVAAGDGPHEITLHAEVVISGAILDDETGEPITPAMVVPVSHYPLRPDDPIVQASQIRVLENGRYSFTEAFWQGGQELVLQFEAMGYRPKRIGPFGPTSGAVSTDVRLERAAPLRGRVLGVDGQPLPGATVAFTTKDTSLIVHDWTYESEGLSKRTDAEGQFAFVATTTPAVMIASHESGYAEVALDVDEQPGDLQLRPWSRVEGRVMRAGEPVVGETVYLSPIRMLGGENPHVQDSFTATTDGSGRFTFDRAPPVPSHVSPYVTVWRETKLMSGESVPLDLQPGKTHVAPIGEKGIVVRGRVRPTGDIAAKLDMTYCLNYLLKRTPGIDPPPPIARAGFDWRNGWSFDLKDSEEGRGFLATLPHHFVKFAPDGAFAVHGVSPGDYQLATSVYEPPEGCLIDPVGRKVFAFTVRAADEEKGELDLGVIDVDVKLGPQIGDPFPIFRYELLEEDGVGSVGDWQGRYLLIDFWATWCGPCIAQLPELKSIAEKLDPERAALLSISLDEDVKKARAFIASKQMDWPQGLLGQRDNPLVRQQLGISSVPVYFVLDPTGKLIHRSFRLHDAVTALENALEQPKDKK